MWKERQAYIEVVKKLGGDMPGRKAALEYMEASDARAHGELLEFPFVPYLFDASDRAFLEEETATAHRILEKVIAAYLADPSYRTLFHFPEEVERLILLPCPYSQLLPLCRLDFFLDEKDRSYKFCEFNADGSGAMSRDWLMGQALMQSESFEEFSRGRDVRQFELFDSWVEAFLACYRESEGAGKAPTVAIVDFEESGVMSDFRRFIQAFERAGCPARFVDARALAFDGKHLVDPSDGAVINAIYRRAVTSELLGHLDECDALIRAVAEEKVVLIGHFRTTVVHSKMVNVALFAPETRAFLAPEEVAFVETHVPRTYRLVSDSDEFDVDEVIADKDSWIVKPEDDYGAHGVYPGVDYAPCEWRCIVQANLDAGCIVQEYYRPHEVPLVNTRLAASGDPCEVESWQSMPGAYLYNGKMAGLYCRLGQGGVIALDHGGLCAPSFMVD